MKYQWHKIEWRISPDQLKEAILNEPYSEELGRGFKLDSFIADRLIGRYIVKKTYTEEIITPLGNQELLDRVQYVMFEFEINTDKQLSLVLTNPPRSITELGSAFARITNHQVTFFPLKIRLKEGISHLFTLLEEAAINRVNLINIPFNNGNVGTLNLRGSGDLLSLISNHAEVSRGSVTKVDLTFKHEQDRRKMSLTSLGTLECDKQVSSFIRPIAETILMQLIDKDK